MSTESSSATLRECPNRECKSTDLWNSSEDYTDVAAVICGACETSGPVAREADWPNVGERIAESHRLWNALPREGDAKAGPHERDFAMICRGSIFIHDGDLGSYTDRLRRIPPALVLAWLVERGHTNASLEVPSDG